MELIKQIQQVKNKYKPLKESAYDKYRQVRDEEEKELASIFNMKGKFLCIDDEKYLYVNEQFEHRNISDGQPIIVLRGQGFRYIITPYTDATYMNWDQFFSHEFKICDIESEIPKLKEITEEEYNEAFCKMVEDIKKEHFKYNKSIIHCNYGPDEEKRNNQES